MKIVMLTSGVRGFTLYDWVIQRREIIFSVLFTNIKMQPAVFHKSHRCLLLSVIVINRPENGKM